MPFYSQSIIIQHRTHTPTHPVVMASSACYESTIDNAVL